MPKNKLKFWPNLIILINSNNYKRCLKSILCLKLLYLIICNNFIILGKNKMIQNKSIKN